MKVGDKVIVDYPGSSEHGSKGIIVGITDDEFIVQTDHAGGQIFLFSASELKVIPPIKHGWVKLGAIPSVLFSAIFLLSACASVGPHDYQDCRLAYFDRELDANRNLEHAIQDSEKACIRYRE